MTDHKITPFVSPGNCRPLGRARRGREVAIIKRCDLDTIELYYDCCVCEIAEFSPFHPGRPRPVCRVILTIMTPLHRKQWPWPEETQFRLAPAVMMMRTNIRSGPSLSLSAKQGLILLGRPRLGQRPLQILHGLLAPSLSRIPTHSVNASLYQEKSSTISDD